MDDMPSRTPRERIGGSALAGSAENPEARTTMLETDVCMRALNARDARFDGVFFVAITSTGIYCRPVCPTRVARAEHRRFYPTAALAERAGYRPCLRCRPELAPGLAVMDAVPRLARLAADRIGAGALNGRAVAELARELGVSERHLRRVLERELGVSPVELAQTHRLLLAKRLLADTSLSVTHIAFASGFQSLRRFNSVFRERYRLSPSAVRRPPRSREAHGAANGAPRADLVKLTLTYRPPLAWNELIALLSSAALPGVETIDDGYYGRTLCFDGHRGVVFAANAAPKAHVTIEVSPSLVPVLMPLMARLRRVFDLDAVPAAIDAHLVERGLGALVGRRPGIRLPGAIDGFEAVLRVLLSSRRAPGPSGELARRIIEMLGEAMHTGFPGLTRLLPSAARIAEAGSERLVGVGMERRRAELLVRLARALADGTLRLEPDGDVRATRRALEQLAGQRLASAIALRALYWPDAFPAEDRALQRATATTSARVLRARAELWRPWRAYAAVHLWLEAESRGRDGRTR
jgi:AraC family transcriptional regulator, regulatory protein of adaptative response / DNA-3-methyladenine glycosylase II